MSEKLPYNLEKAQDEAADMLDKIKSGDAEDYADAGDQIESEERQKRREKAYKHWENGHLGVTAEDHWAIGGTPEIELRRNPGKTLGELWTVDQFREKLESSVTFLEKARGEYKEKGPNHPDIHWSRDDILSAKQELRGTIRYLKSIGKLPEEFENFEVKDLKSDPR